MDYKAFLDQKTQLGANDGFVPTFMPDYLFPFQSFLTDWSIRHGRSGLFEDCGLGKTIQSLVWSENVVRHTNKNVLNITPLAVSPQTVAEGEKFGIECTQSRDGKIRSKITVTNYERLHYFDPADFVGVVLDEAAAIKAFDGKRRKIITRFMAKVPYRLAQTATPAPNDFIELGTISEALGQLPQSEMLSMFFKSSDNMRQIGRAHV